MSGIGFSPGYDTLTDPVFGMYINTPNASYTPNAFGTLRAGALSRSFSCRYYPQLICFKYTNGFGGSGGTRTPSGLTPITDFQDQLLAN